MAAASVELARPRPDDRTGQFADVPAEEAGPSERDPRVARALNVSMLLNVFLAVIKTFVVIASGSLAVLASLIDSLLDLLAQFVVWYTSRRAEKSANTTKFPAGQRRLEPLGVMLCAGVMSVASLEVLRQAIGNLAQNENTGVTINATALAIIASVVVSKIFAWLYCRAVDVQSESLKAVTQDHLNDVFSNTVALVAAGVIELTSGKMWWMDSVGALLLSVYILFNWFQTAREQIDFLVGKAASPDIIAEMKDLAEKHHKDMSLDHLRMYYFGPKFLVELEMVMNEQTPLKVSHDLGMTLQWKIEAMEEVERCFVHIDWQSREYDEHQINLLYNKDNPNYALVPTTLGSPANSEDLENQASKSDAFVSEFNSDTVGAL